MFKDADDPVVAGRDLEKRYGQGAAAVHALRGVTLELHPGTFTAIMGPSGSGKSTLMHLLAGLDQPTAGEVWLGPTKLTGLGDSELTRLRRTRVGFVFQTFNLLPMLTGNLDSRSTEVLHMFRRAVEYIGQTIALVTHDPVAAAHADRILFLNDGQIVRETGKLSTADVVETVAAVR